MIDSRTVGSPFNEPTLWAFRYTGANANALTAVATTSKKTALSRSGVGTLSASINDANPPATTGGLTGVVQIYDFWIASPNNNKTVQVTPPTAGSASFTCNVVWTANGVAVDVQSYEEFCGEVWTSRSSNP